MSASTSQGICILAGAGPGDPGLVTLRTRECIERADVVLYDHLVTPEILRWVRPDAEVIYVGKKAGEHSAMQAEINAMVLEKTRQGKMVVRLKGGDPILFGRGGEEALELARAGLRFEIVPGVSSAIGGPAYAGIPLTHPELASQVTIFTGHETPDKADSALDYASLASAPGTMVMVMGVTKLESITRELLKHGANPELPVSLIRWASTGRQQTLSAVLGDIAQRVKESGFTPPAIAVFGEVNRFREQLNWFENRPLFGKRIVVTRVRRQGAALAAGLRALGADVLEIPTLRVEKPVDQGAFASSVEDVPRYDWVVFSSPDGVDAFFGEFFRNHNDVREFGGARIATFGAATAERVKAFHLAVDLQLKEPFAGSISGFGSIDNVRFLVVRAEHSRGRLAAELTSRQGIVNEVIAYRTSGQADDASGALTRFQRNGADMITFASPSAAEGFFALNLPMPEGLKIASIGPTTSSAIRERGLAVDVEAKPHDIASMVEAIAAYYR